MRTIALATLLATTLLGLALAAPENDARIARGKELFHDTQDLEYASCAQCHSLLPESDEPERATHLGPGTTLYGSAVRAGWRNMNTYSDVGHALQYCAKSWQKRKRGFKPTDRDALVAFLKQHVPEGPLPKRKVQRKPKLLTDLEGGDPEKGRELTLRYCGGCHNETDDALSFELRPNKKRKGLVARKVRGYNAKRQFKPKDGSMSYFTTDRLSDEDLLQILAYVGK